VSEAYLCIYPADIGAPKPDWPKLRDRLVEIGFMVPTGEAEIFAAGPLYDRYRNYTSERVRREALPRISFSDHGGKIMIHCGPIDEPPGIPGTDRVIEDWIDFIGQWVEDSTRRWIDPETGKDYSLLEFDFQNRFAACRWTIEIKQPDYLDPVKTTELISELVGETLRWALFHL
jgi:hypothetical protein